MRIAVKTLEAIATTMRFDQGAKFRHYLRECMPLAEDAYTEDEGDFRAHLGASLIGRECPRELWFTFHWATLKRFEGQTLRLFNRGHLEEPRMVALLKMIGCTVYQYAAPGEQYRINGHNWHYGGSLDAVISGCPDIPTEAILGEFKTHGDKSFQKLKSDGVMSSKWEHFVQCQQYMGKMRLPFALYMGVNKNDDELHAEIITFDPGVYQRYEARAGTIIEAREPPPRISDTPGFFKCKFCDHIQVCHLKKPPARNCRTCQWSLPVENGKWVCQQPIHDAAYGDNVPLSEADQLAGCQDYEVNPAI